MNAVAFEKYANNHASAICEYLSTVLDVTQSI